jgi:hypothetical protein
MKRASGPRQESRASAPTSLTWLSGILLCLVLVSVILGLACQRHVVLSRTESGGLGLNRSEWEQTHGPAVSRDSAYVRYRLEDADVFLNFTRASGATDVWVRYSTSDGVPLESARGMARGLIPVDSSLRRTYAPLEGGTADAFTSESLTRLDDTDSEGESRGSFTVWYSVDHRSVSGFTIRTGKGPPEP